MFLCHCIYLYEIWKCYHKWFFGEYLAVEGCIVFFKKKYDNIFEFKNVLFFQSPLVQAIFSRDTEEVTFLLNHNEDASSLVMLSH